MGNTEDPVSDALLRAFFRELVCCLGRVSARHQLPEDAVWELVKGFDILYQRARRNAEVEPQAPGDPLPPVRKLEPHPGIAYLLARLEREGGR